ncbi:MAG: Gfo/Idh/MocA family oxidoreductase, partial [Gemmatimonadota bacterium]
MPNVRWGVLGTASIATRKMIPALQAAGNGELVAIASRDLAAAERAAASSGISQAFGSYQALLDDPDVDAIYIPLPNHLHVEWSIRALEAGKHVLCEKPIGLNALEARTLLEATRKHPQLKVGEAFMYRCHPRWDLVRTLVNEGAIGALRAVHTVFSYDNHDPANIRNVAAMGGGAWLDIGCYGVSVARWLYIAEPISVRGAQDVDPLFGTARQTTALLEFVGGTAAVMCATQLAPHQS